MKEIEKYISMAVNNWLELNDYFITNWLNYDSGRIDGVFIYNQWKYAPYISLEKLITSDDFITAIAIWLTNSNIDTIDCLKYIERKEFITINQAKAIRDKKLDEFISKII